MGRAVVLCERHVKAHVDALIASRVSCQVPSLSASRPTAAHPIQPSPSGER